MSDRARPNADHDDRIERFHRERRAKASLADGYLDQALGALRDAAIGDALWRRELPPRYGRSSILGPMQQRLTVVNERLTFLRTAVLFSALGLEATVNQFLAIVLSPADVETIDRKPTLYKLIQGPPLAGADTPFERGREPMQTLKRLMDARNALVHPRPGEAATLAHVVMTDDDLKTYGPKAAVDYLKAAAHAGVLLGNSCTTRSPSRRLRRTSGGGGRCSTSTCSGSPTISAHCPTLTSRPFGTCSWRWRHEQSQSGVIAAPARSAATAAVTDSAARYSANSPAHQAASKKPR